MSNRADTPEGVHRLWANGSFAELTAMAATNPALLNDPQSAFFISLAHIYTGGVDRAEPILDRLIKSDPGFFNATATLAKLYIVTGRARLASPLFQRLERDAQIHPAAAHQLADAYLQARRVGDAYRLFTRLKDQTGAPIADVGLAETLMRSGRVREGVEAARRARDAMGVGPVLNVLGAAAHLEEGEDLLAEVRSAVAVLPAPRAAGLYEFWTDILMSGEYFTAAIVTAERLVELAPTSARWRLISDLKLALHDLPGALAAAQSAHAADPNDAQSMVMLARCHIVGGDTAAAAALLRQAIDADAAAAGAYDYLTQIDPSLITAEDTVRMQELRGGGADPRIALSMGRAAEARGEYAAAFDLYAEAKRDLARAAEASGQGYDRGATADGVRRLVAAFPYPRTLSAELQDGPRPIFIVGMPRSGTSLIEQVLSSHPQVAALGEAPAMMANLKAFLPLTGDAQGAIDEYGVAWRNHYAAGIPTTNATATTDKHPLNFWSVGLIRALYPDARIIHSVRDATDTSLSIFKQRFYAEYRFANDLDTLAHYYAAYERMMAHWSAVFGDAIHVVRYEQLTASFETEARALVEFCGLPWDAACLDFYRAERPVFTHSAAQVRKPVSTSSIARGRKFGDKMKPFEDALAQYREAL